MLLVTGFSVDNLCGCLCPRIIMDRVVRTSRQCLWSFFSRDGRIQAEDDHVSACSERIPASL